MAATMAKSFSKPPQKRRLEDLSSDDDDQDSNASIESDQEIEETPEEKRLRLASIYLEELQRKEDEARENVSHDDVNARLRKEELEQSQKLVKFVANKFKSFGHVSQHKDKVHNKALTCLAISSDNASVFTASKDGAIVKWSLGDQGPKMAIRKKSLQKQLKGSKAGHDSIVNTMAVSSDNKYMATGDDSSNIFVWKCSDLDYVKCFKGHRGPITGLAFARDKNVLYSCSRDRSVKTWDLDQMGYVETLFGHQDSVSCIIGGISCDFLTGGSRDGTVRLWRTADEVQLVFNHNASVEALDTINAELFATVGDNGQISIWSTRKKTPLCSKALSHGIDPANSCARWISALAVFSCSDLIATGSYDGHVRLWKVNTKTKVIEAVAEVEVQGFVNDLVFSSDGKFLLAATGQEHRNGRWWSLKQCKNQLVCIPLNFEEEI